MERTRAVIDAYRTILRSTSAHSGRLMVIRSSTIETRGQQHGAGSDGRTQGGSSAIQRKLQEADEAAQRASAPSEGRGEAKLVRERQRARAEEAAARRRCVQRKRRQRGSTVGYKSRSVSNSSGTRNSAQRSFAESAMLKMRPHFGPPRWLPACGTTIGRSGSIFYERGRPYEGTYVSEREVWRQGEVEVPDLYVASLESHGIQVYGGHYTDRRAGFYSDARARLESVIEDIDVIVKGRDAMMKDPDVLAALHKAGFMATPQSRASRKNWRYVIIDRRRLRTTHKAIILAALATAGAVYRVCDRLPPRTADDQLRDFIYGHDREPFPYAQLLWRP